MKDTTAMLNKEGPTRESCWRIGDPVEADIARRQTAAVCLKSLRAAGLREATRAGREYPDIDPPL